MLHLYRLTRGTSGVTFSIFRNLFDATSKIFQLRWRFTKSKGWKLWTNSLYFTVKWAIRQRSQKQDGGYE